MHLARRFPPSIATASESFKRIFVVKGAKRRLRRSKTLDNKILLKHTATVAIDGFL